MYLVLVYVFVDSFWLHSNRKSRIYSRIIPSPLCVLLNLLFFYSIVGTDYINFTTHLHPHPQIHKIESCLFYYPLIHNILVFFPVLFCVPLRLDDGRFVRFFPILLSFFPFFSCLFPLLSFPYLFSMFLLRFYFLQHFCVLSSYLFIAYLN